MALPICSICTSGLEGRTNISAVTCGHVFHYNCVAKWVARCENQGRSASCPTCKQPVNLRKSSGSIHKLYFQYDGDGKSREVRDLEAKLEAAASEKRSQNSRLENLETLLAVNDSLIDKYKKGEARYKSRFEADKVAMSSLKKKYDALSVKMKTSEESLKNANEEKQKMKFRIRVLEKNVALSAEQYEGSLKDLKSERNYFETLLDNFESLQDDLWITRAAKNQTDAQFEEVSRQKYESEATYASLKKDHDALLEKLTALDEESVNERKRSTAKLNELELAHAHSITMANKDWENRIVKEQEVAAAKQNHLELAYARSFATVTKAFEDRIMFLHLDRALNATEGYCGALKDKESDLERPRSATGQIPAKMLELKSTIGILPKPETNDVNTNREPCLITRFSKKPIEIQEITKDDVRNAAKDTLKSLPEPRDSSSIQNRVVHSVLFIALLFVLKIPSFIILSVLKTFFSLQASTPSM